MKIKYHAATCGILIALCWVFAAAPSGALEADIYEVDNTAAQSLSRAALNDGAQTHTIHVTNDIDYVHFSVSAGHTYTLETTLLDASMDTYLYLLAANGTTVLTENDDSGVGFASLISYKFDMPGTFYALIEHYSLNHGTHAGSTGTYSIALTDLGAEGAFGTIKWQRPVYNSFSSPAIGPDGKIYIGSTSNALLCLNPDGTTARIWQTTAAVHTPPALDADGKVYAATLAGLVYCFNPDGTTGYVWNAGSPVYGAPAIGSDGTVYIGAINSNLYAFNGSDGSTAHVWRTEGQIPVAPVIGNDGSIYVGTLTSNLYCFAPDGSTSRVWRTDSGIYYGSLTIDTNGFIYVPSLMGNLFCFNPDGTTNRVWRMAAFAYSAPAISGDGTLYIGSAISNSYAFNPDGTTNHVYSCNGRAMPLICSDGSIYFVGEKLYNVNPDGTTNWSLNYAWTGLAGGPALDTNGILYVNNGNLLAIYATGALAQTVWPKYQHDLKNTGKLAPPAPTNCFASDGLYSESILVGWTPVSSASGYDLYRGTNTSESAAQICGSEIAATNFMDSNVMAGITYYYWPKARDNSGASALFGQRDTGWGHTFVSSPVGDYDHDGKADPAAYNDNNGNWKVKFSSANYALATAENLLGGAGWTAVTADFDGDAIADPAVYQEATGNWIVKLSAANYFAVTLENFLGAQGYSGLAADVDGDGKADPATYDENHGAWAVKLSGIGYVTTALAQTLGSPGWCAVLADFDGDGRADPAVYQEQSGAWAVRLSSAGDFYILIAGLLGEAGFRPVPADYDGDGLADPAVYNPTSGDWKVMLSSANYYLLEISGLLAP